MSTKKVVEIVLLGLSVLLTAAQSIDSALKKNANE